MTTITELKNEIVKGDFERGLFTSTNEDGDTVIVEKQTNMLKVSTFQKNNWIRINVYTYEPEDKTWTEEEMYER